MADGKGLYLEITPHGAKHWKFKYTRPDSGKSNWMSFGEYGEKLITLAMARVKREEARGLLARGIDPVQDKKDKKALAANAAANTFEVVARLWHVEFAPSWKPNTAKNNLHRLEKDIFPQIGKMPMHEITPQIMLSAIQTIEKRGAIESAKRLAENCNRVFEDYRFHHPEISNPIPAIRSKLKTPTETNHASINVAGLPALLKALSVNEGRMYHPNRIGLRLMLLTFVRTSELIETPWAEVDLENEIWVIPWQRMKMEKP